MTKIIDIFAGSREKSNLGANFSIEYFPPRTAEGHQNLVERIARLAKLEPIFQDVTWGAGGSNSEKSLKLAQEINCDLVPCNLHLTCSGMDQELVDQILEQIKETGIRNLCLLRGDLPVSELQAGKKWHQPCHVGKFQSGLDLVKYVREKYQAYFGISVAGYPEGHPDQIEEVEQGQLGELSQTEKARLSFRDNKYWVCRDQAYWDDLAYLKEKVNAGADLVISQLFFDSSLFIQFVEDCRSIGITCPIIPGILLIQSYQGFLKMTSLCKVKVPSDLMLRLEKWKDDKTRMTDLAIEVANTMIYQMFESGITTFHFYCLNREKVLKSVVGYVKGLSY